MPDIRYLEPENLAKRIILIDGLTRTGKSIFSHLVGTFTNHEHIQFLNPLEQVLSGLSLGSIDPSLARAFIRTYLNERVYDTMISRNSNFRHSDQTGVTNHPEPWLYFERLSKDDGDEVVQELRSTSRVFTFMTHDVMLNFPHFKFLLDDFKLIEVVRDPVAIAHSCYVRGWGKRFGTDARSFTLCTSKAGVGVPWYATQSDIDWINMNELERCAWLASDLTQRLLRTLRSSSDRRVLVVCFERFVTETLSELNRIADFLGQSPTDETYRQLTLARCPRQLDSELRASQLGQFIQGIGPEHLEYLQASVHDYQYFVASEIGT